jgi:hypothetical protein
LIILTKEDKFYCIDISNEKIPSFIINDDNSVIDEMIITDLCYKQINDLHICDESQYCFARNDDDYNIYFYNINYGVMKEYIGEEKIIDMCCGFYHSILLTQSGKVYEYLPNKNERENSEKYIHFKLKLFKNYSFENEKIVMISCGWEHSLALTESGRVFGWGINDVGELGVDVKDSNEPIIIELNDLKIKKVSCGLAHSLLLSCDGDIYAFGRNWNGEVGNGTQKTQRLPIKLEINNKFIDIASRYYYPISMSQSIDGIYVWGEFEGKAVLSPQPTKYESFEAILISNNYIINMKTFGKLIEFKDSFLKNGFYSKNFQEIDKLGFGSFGSVFKVKLRDKYISRLMFRESEYSAIKRIEFTSVDKSQIITEYHNYLKITRKYSENKYLVKHFDAWFEESVVANQSGISLYIEMELCDKTLEDVIDEFESKYLKTNGTLTTVGYYIASQIFIQILKGVNYLHKQKKPLIHRDLKPANILLKKSEAKGICVKIADFGLIAIHESYEKSHTSNEKSHTSKVGTPYYMAPEVRNGRKYNTKADIYSLGVIFEELFDLNSIE